MHELLIIGAGPAGLTAAIYAARAGVETMVIERIAGGQVAETSEVENYPGFLSVGGIELALKMREQAEKQGAAFRSGTVSALKYADNVWTASLSGGDEMSAKTVIIATGASRRKLGVQGEKEYAGAGVSYCATCDGGFFKGLDVAVAGGGSSAFEDALYLAKICRKVYIVHRRDGFRAEQKLVVEARSKPNIEFVLGVTVESIKGNGGVVDSIAVRNTDGVERTVAVSGLFVAIGTVPNSEMLNGLVPLDDNGYALIDEYCDAGNGLFVAGDTRKKPIYQIVSAASDGAVSASGAVRYLQS